MQFVTTALCKLWLITSQGCMDAVDYVTQHSITEMMAVVLTVVIVMALYHLLFVPIDRRMKLEDVSYVPGVGQSLLSKKELANMVFRKKKQSGDGDCELPVFPNGWFCIAESRFLKAGEITRADYLGLSLAVFRDESGEVHAIDSTCPHMGADLTVGGRVFGDCIECPFHGWKFRGHDGQCTSIPYAEKIPSIAKVKSYKVLECNDHVYLWYHAEDTEPTWYPPVIDEMRDGVYSYGGRTEHFVTCHIQDIPENGADLGHLNFVHKESILAGTDLRKKYNVLHSFTQHNFHDVSWTAQEAPLKHVGVLKVSASLEFFGVRISPSTIPVNVSQIGPGIVHLNFGKTIMLHHVTPMGPFLQHVRHQIYSSMPTVYSKLIMFAESQQFERDVMIWNSKRALARPAMSRSKEDELIARHRRWYSQFYSDNSPKLKLSTDTLDW